MPNRKSMRQLMADFRNCQGRVDKTLTRILPMMGEESVKIIRQNFDLQGYDTGDSFHPWARRADVTNAAYDYNRNPNSQRIRVGKNGKIVRGRREFVTSTGKQSKAKNQYKGSTFQSTNPILEQTRTLKRAPRWWRKGQRSITVGVDPALVVYAQKMNEGGPGKWGKYAKTNTPARQFMPRPSDPPNKKMIRAYEAKVRYELDQAMGEFRNFRKTR